MAQEDSAEAPYERESQPPTSTSAASSPCAGHEDDSATEIQRPEHLVPVMSQDRPRKLQKVLLDFLSVPDRTGDQRLRTLANLGDESAPVVEDLSRAASCHHGGHVVEMTLDRGRVDSESRECRREVRRDLPYRVTPCLSCGRHASKVRHGHVCGWRRRPCRRRRPHHVRG